MKVLSRRAVLLGAACAACAAAPTPGPAAPPGPLVACFSRTGNTGAVAEQIHAKLGGARFDIAPEVPYPDDYQAVVAQSKRELGAGVRPALREDIAEPTSFGVIFLGFPIWHMTMPPVVQSFLSRHDLAGRTVVPFCTHKGYGRGDSFTVLARWAPRARILPGFDIEGIKAASAAPSIEQWLRRIQVPAA